MGYIYLGVDDNSKKVVSTYIELNGASKKILHQYVSIDGIAKPVGLVLKQKTVSNSKTVNIPKGTGYTTISVTVNIPETIVDIVSKKVELYVNSTYLGDVTAGATFSGDYKTASYKLQQTAMSYNRTLKYILTYTYYE